MTCLSVSARVQPLRGWLRIDAINPGFRGYGPRNPGL
jgi:hypothetical protein